MNSWDKAIRGERERNQTGGRDGEREGEKEKGMIGEKIGMVGWDTAVLETKQGM
jgi:hypothetical protein